MVQAAKPYGNPVKEQHANKPWGEVHPNSLQAGAAASGNPGQTGLFFKAAGAPLHAGRPC